VNSHETERVNRSRKEHSTTHSIMGEKHKGKAKIEHEEEKRAQDSDREVVKSCYCRSRRGSRKKPKAVGNQLGNKKRKHCGKKTGAGLSAIRKVYKSRGNKETNKP